MDYLGTSGETVSITLQKIQIAKGFHVNYESSSAIIVKAVDLRT
jgi:hypothetical protein